MYAEPTTTILSSPSIASPAAASWNPMSLVTFPSPSNVLSNPPRGLKRTSAKSKSPLTSRVPATAILPSLWMVTSLASSKPPKFGGRPTIPAERRVRGSIRVEPRHQEVAAQPPRRDDPAVRLDRHVVGGVAPGTDVGRLLPVAAERLVEVTRRGGRRGGGGDEQERGEERGHVGARSARSGHGRPPSGEDAETMLSHAIG